MSGSSGSGGSNGCKAKKRNFLSQPAVKTIFVYRNGDSYSEARRVLIHEKRVCDLDALLREVTGRIRPPYGAVRTIYTPRAGHRVDSLDYVQNGEQYVAAGTEKFKKINYLQIQRRRKQMLQTNEVVKPVQQNRVVVSARFLKPIKEPCAIFVVPNGDVLNPAVRFLVPNRLLDQFERILEMITEKIGLRILGGVRSLCTFDGVLVTDGKELENGQFYVAVGRDKFKHMPYADLLFFKPIGTRRNVRSKACSLPPIYRYGKQNGEVVNGASNVGITETKVRKPVVRQISQSRPMTLHKKRSNLTMSLSSQDNADEGEHKADEDEESEDKSTLKDPSQAEQENSCEHEGGEDDTGATEEPAEDVGVAKESTELGDDEGTADIETNLDDEAATEEPVEDEVAFEGDGKENDMAVEEDEAVERLSENETAEENVAAEGDETAGDNETTGDNESVTQTTEEGDEVGGDEEVPVVGEDAAGEEEDAAGGEGEVSVGEEGCAGEEDKVAKGEEELGGEEEEVAGGEDEEAGGEEEDPGVKEDEGAGGEDEAEGGEELEPGGEEELAAGGEDEAAGEQGDDDEGAADDGGGDDS